MAKNRFLEQLIGSWRGTYTLYEPPTETPLPSPSVLTVKPVLADRFLEISYDWKLRKDRQRGLMWLAFEPKEKAVNAAWLDTWHNGDKVMACAGTMKGRRGLTLHGAFSVPSGPPWGWRTVIRRSRDESLELNMDCLPPGGQEILGCRATYKRAAK